LTSKLIHKTGLDKDAQFPETVPSKRPDETAQSSFAAVISAAVREYRKKEEGRPD
jgi:Na+-transporting methylmalonyl-CoA/oxaloacetate decarboxylase gamma subunit